MMLSDDGRTFAEMSDAHEQYSLCRELCHDLAKDVQREGLKVELHIHQIYIVPLRGW